MSDLYPPASHPARETARQIDRQTDRQTRLNAVGRESKYKVVFPVGMSMDIAMPGELLTKERRSDGRQRCILHLDRGRDE